MNINSGAGSTTNVVISSSVAKDTLTLASTLSGLAFGFLVTRLPDDENFLNRALYVGACSVAGHLIAKTAYHSCSAFWQRAVEIRDTVSTYINNPDITPTSQDSHIARDSGLTLNTNSDAGSTTNVVISTSVMKDTLSLASTLSGLAFGYLVFVVSNKDNFLNRGLYLGACGTAGYLFAQSACHGCTALWKGAEVIRATVSTYMNNLGIPPFSQDSHIVQAFTYAGACYSLRYSRVLEAPLFIQSVESIEMARRAHSGRYDPPPCWPPPGVMDRIKSGPSSVMLGAGAGYLVGKALDYTAKAAFSGARMAAECLRSITTGR
ncbi:hypothetical protein J7438_05500 [Thalassotalea sp. G20_0]|uniref:hypothetical protein n=1 Tax=Thalassotalea sp. G20_0 TaxID=2821093 RepID=UPI001ADA624A|nr:hypothetical protein [Thalassotalea sp. G20_0]MBO9493541.1 hypothetical protein [Thalassotalea sp. G20_0]